MYKTVERLDEAGWHKVEIEVEAGFDDAGYYEIKRDKDAI